MRVQTGFVITVSVKKASTKFYFKTLAYNKLNCITLFALCFSVFLTEINTVGQIQDGGYKTADNKMGNYFYYITCLCNSIPLKI